MKLYHCSQCDIIFKSHKRFQSHIFYSHNYTHVSYLYIIQANKTNNIKYSKKIVHFNDYGLSPDEHRINKKTKTISKFVS